MQMKRRGFLGRLSLLGAMPAAAAGAERDGRLPAPARDLLEEIAALPVVDTHEHIIPESERVAQPVDFFTLAGHYAINDVISAGLPEEAQKLIEDLDAPMDRRWRAFEPYWKYARFTGYGQALRIAVCEVYGTEEISATTLGRINDAIRRRNKPGLYDEILRRKARIEYAVLDDYWNAAPV